MQIMFMTGDFSDKDESSIAPSLSGASPPLLVVLMQGIPQVRLGAGRFCSSLSQAFRSELRRALQNFYSCVAVASL
jgi:hypothetical protein